MIAAFGAIMGIRPLIRKTVHEAVTDATTDDGGDASQIGLQLTRTEIAKDVRSSLTGTIFVLIGAAVGGYSEIALRTLFGW